MKKQTVVELDGTDIEEVFRFYFAENMNMKVDEVIINAHGSKVYLKDIDAVVKGEDNNE